MAVPVYTSTGSKATTAVKLDKAVFSVIPENHDILKLAYTAYLANGRENLARTKTRGQVRGGGIKPWRQKGTGRARFGSIRVPIWRGGGITFGPTGNENYKIKVPLQTKRLAIKQSLSLAAEEGKLAIIEDLKIKSLKTSDAAKLLKKLNATKRVLIGVDNKTTELTRAFNNIPNVKIVSAKYLNTYDLMNADSIILTVDALKIVHEWLGEAK